MYSEKMERKGREKTSQAVSGLVAATRALTGRPIAGPVRSGCGSGETSRREPWPIAATRGDAFARGQINPFRNGVLFGHGNRNR